MRTLLVALAALSLAAPVQAQSLYNSAGLGSPIEPIDGRSRSMGNLGIGMWGASLSPFDPAAAAGLIAPSAVIVGQPSWVEFDRGGTDTGSFQGTRFPLIGIAYPAFDGMATVSLGSLLDQRFSGSRDITFDLLEGASGATDDFDQEGAVSDVRFGFARRVGERVGLGLAVGRYAGSVTRGLRRDFDNVGTGLEDFAVVGRWGYSGTSFTAGATADVGDLLRVAASATMAGTLHATVQGDLDGEDRSFDLPTQLRVGASAVLSEGLMLTASLVQADWSDVAGDLGPGIVVAGTSGYGVGIELSRARLLGLQAPLRFGYRSNDLPFAYGSRAASETIWAGGLGLTLSEQNGFVLASADLALERGERSDALLTESFWRATVSLRVSGF